MTIPDRFRDRMRLLGRLKFAPVDLAAHFIVLQHESDDDLQHAIERAVGECDEFPTPRMLKAFIRERRAHDAAPVVRHDRERSVEPQTITLPGGGSVTTNREWKYYCDDCHDSGRLSVWCGTSPPPRPWLQRRTCERQHFHGEHEYEIFCKCIARNPDVPAWVKARVATATKALTS